MTIEGMHTSWKDSVIELLKNRPATLQLKQIATDTGIPEGWLSMFANGRISGPDINRVQTIYHYLSPEKAKKLKL